MTRFAVVVVLSAVSGGLVGYFLLGRARTWFTLFDGEGLLGLLLGILWRVMLYQGTLLVAPFAVFLALGFYPLRPVEVIGLFLSAFLSSVLSERVFRQRSARAVRAAGLIGEKDLYDA